MSHTVKLFRVTATLPGHREPFVDWYEAHTVEAARELWREDAHRYGIPNEKADAAALVIVECDTKTLKVLEVV